MREPLLNAKDCCRLGNFSHSQLYRLIARGLWPQPVKIGESSRWIPDEAGAAIQALADARKPNPPKVREIGTH